MKSKLFFLCLFLLASIINFSQESRENKLYKINGTVTDTVENAKLSYVNVALLSKKDSSFIKSGITNDNGEFLINQIDSGEYLLRVMNISYITLYKQLTISDNIRINLFIHKTDTELGEVTVTADNKIYSLETDKRIYLTANDESIQNAFATDALENAPGVYIDINDNIIVRGQIAQIYINGKPTIKSKEMMQNYLETLNASQIEKIEVITNPSAEFSATNTNIIVNIVLKKETVENRLLALGAIYSTMPRYGMWASYFKKGNKFDFNFYGRLLTKNMRSGNLYESYSIAEDDTAYYSKIINSQSADAFLIKPYVDFTYRINNKTSISGKAVYQYYTENNQNVIETWTKFNNPYKYNANSAYAYVNSGIGVAVDFNKSFNDEKHNIFLKTTYSDIRTNFGDTVNETNSDLLFKTFKYSSGKATSKYLIAEGNYNLPLLENLIFSVGFYSEIIRNLDYQNLVDTVSSLYNNKTFNNILSQQYIENKPAYEFYTTLSGKISDVKYKIGIRYEQEIYNLKQTIPKNTIKKLYQNFYPSVHLSYKTKTDHNFSISYSRRVNTPVYYLNPYIDRSNNDYVSAGNPELQFAATNSYDLTYFKNLKNGNITFSLYRYDTKNDINSVNQTVFDDYFNKTVVLQTYANCANTNFTGYEMSLSSKLFKTIDLQLNTNIYFKQIKGEYNNSQFNNDNFAYNARLSFSHKFFNRFDLKIIPTYRSPEAGFFQTEKYDFYINSSLNFDFFEKKFSIYIKAEDIFDTRIRVTEYQTDDFYQYSQNIQYYPRIKFVVVYRIGNSKYDRQAKINQLTR